MADVRAILDTVFGCCLGRRNDRRSAESSARGRDGADANERTPLLADRNGVGKDGSGREDLAGPSRLQDPQQGRNSKQKPDAESTVALSFGKRRRRIDPSALQAVQDRANTAFFNVDCSQLLPSSSSMAQRQAAMGASQRLSRRDQSRDRQAGDDDLSARRRRELIAASDQAERLYTAAMKSRAGVPASTKESADQSQVPSQHPSPISLVRQIRLAVYDTSRRPRNVEEQSADRPDLVSKDSSQTARAPPSRSASEFHASTSVSPIHNSTSQLSAIRHTPSVHSLRTLRLGLLANEAETGVENTVDSTASKRLATNDDGLGKRQEDEDDEDWQRRGRTRSRRSLVWMDMSAQGDAVDGKVRLEEIFAANEQNDGQGKRDRVDEIKNGVRFDGENDGRRRSIVEVLRQSDQSHVSEMWDDVGNLSNAVMDTH